MFNLTTNNKRVFKKFPLDFKVMHLLTSIRNKGPWRGWFFYKVLCV